MAIAALATVASAQEIPTHKLANIIILKAAVDVLRESAEQTRPEDDAGLAATFNALVQVARSYSTMVGVDTDLHNQRYSQWETDLRSVNAHLETTAIHAIYVVHSLGDAAVAQGANPDHVKQIAAAPTLSYLSGAPPDEVIATSTQAMVHILSEALRAEGVADWSLQLTTQLMERALPGAQNRLAESVVYLTAASDLARSLTGRATMNLDVMLSINRMLKRFEVSSDTTTHEAIAKLSYQVAVYLFFAGVAEYVGPSFTISVTPDPSSP